MHEANEKKELRNFGLIVGGVFCLIAVWPAFRHGEAIRFWALVPGSLLIALGLLMPMTLGPIFRVWMKIGHVMGWINTRIILGLVFYLVVTPTGMIRRLFGKDPMGKAIRTDLNSYRIIPKLRPASHLKRQY